MQKYTWRIVFSDGRMMESNSLGLLIRALLLHQLTVRECGVSNPRMSKQRLYHKNKGLMNIHEYLIAHQTLVGMIKAAAGFHNPKRQLIFLGERYRDFYGCSHEVNND